MSEDTDTSDENDAKKAFESGKHIFEVVVIITKDDKPTYTLRPIRGRQRLKQVLEFCGYKEIPDPSTPELAYCLPVWELTEDEDEIRNSEDMAFYVYGASEREAYKRASLGTLLKLAKEFKIDPARAEIGYRIVDGMRKVFLFEGATLH